jgi:hypothetical protein
MIEGGVSPLQLEKHILLKRVYQKYETWNIDMEPPKPNSLEKHMGHSPPYIKNLYHQRRLEVGLDTPLKIPK